MGQYHTIYNKTKKECIRMGGAKLLEQSHSATAAALLLLLSNSRGGGDFRIYPENYKKNLSAQDHADRSIIDIVSGHWAGDKLVVQGDYAEKGDPSYIVNTDDYTNITRSVCDALLIADNGENSDFVKIIESENQYIDEISKVEKVNAKDRNGQKQKRYRAK